MPVYNWDRLEEEQLNPRLSRRVIHTQNLTVARLLIHKGAVVPEHHHVHEQVTLVQSGALRFVISGSEQIARPGDVIQIPPDAPHHVEALEDSVVLDLFSPVREDWIAGDDAYLRR
ncbi:MAG TPA: cupin domain-containing protein [Bryobacteraceae bacterium]|nr:cupin domain-containing protein [Bryobacteraceae bacterium]